jgi:plasmid stabilization system protein ParE
VFHPEAFQELDEAVAYYAERSLWAATAFEEAVEKACGPLQQPPHVMPFSARQGCAPFG